MLLVMALHENRRFIRMFARVLTLGNILTRPKSSQDIALSSSQDIALRPAPLCPARFWLHAAENNYVAKKLPHAKNFWHAQINTCKGEWKLKLKQQKNQSTLLMFTVPECTYFKLSHDGAPRCK